MPSPLETSRARIPALDGLRGLAILGVIFSKCELTPGFPGESSRHLAHLVGSISVDLFFVVSGYLITQLLLAERERRGAISLPAFYWRRSVRILPAYLTLLLTLWMLDGRSEVDIRRIDWFSAWTYTVNFIPESSWDVGHLWSLSIEEHFYLLWPLALVALSPTAARRVIAALVAFTLLGRALVLAFRPDDAWILEVWTCFRWDTIAVGCWLALALNHEPWQARLVRLADARFALPAAGATLGIAAGMMLSNKLGLTIGYTLTACALGAILLLALRRRGLWVRVLESRPLVMIGVLSYSLYLWHRLFLRPQTEADWLWFPWNLACLFAAAIACHLLVEKPFLKLKSALPKRQPALPYGSGLSAPR